MDCKSINLDLHALDREIDMEWDIGTMIFHDQDIDIQEPVLYLETQLNQLGYANHCVHEEVKLLMALKTKKAF